MTASTTIWMVVLSAMMANGLTRDGALNWDATNVFHLPRGQPYTIAPSHRAMFFPATGKLVLRNGSMYQLAAAAATENIKYRSCRVQVYVTQRFPALTREDIPFILDVASTFFHAANVNLTLSMEPAMLEWTTMETNVSLLLSTMPARQDICANLLFDHQEYEDNIIGLAFVGTACTTEGSNTALVSGTDVTKLILIVAHEMGHSFSSGHVPTLTIMNALLGPSIQRVFGSTAANAFREWAIPHKDTCLAGTVVPNDTETPAMSKSLIIILAGVGGGVVLLLIVSYGLFRVVRSHRQSGGHRTDEERAPLLSRHERA